MCPYDGYEVQYELDTAGCQRQVAASDGLQSHQLDGAGADNQLATARVEEPQQVHLATETAAGSRRDRLSERTWLHTRHGVSTQLRDRLSEMT